MADMNPSPRSPGPTKGFLRNNWLAMTGITAVVATIGFPLVAVIRNNEAEYQATGDFGALFGHPFDDRAHGAFKSQYYAALIAKNPDLRLAPDDTPEIRAMKISAINAQTKAILQAKIDASTIVQRKVITGPAEARASVYQREMDSEALEKAMEINNAARYKLAVAVGGVSQTAKIPFQLFEIDKHSVEYIDLVKQQIGVELGQYAFPAVRGVDPPSHMSVQDNDTFKAALSSSPITVRPSAVVTATKYENQEGVGWSKDRNNNTIVLVTVKQPDGNTDAGFISAADYSNLGFPALGALNFHTDSRDKDFMQSGR